MAVSVATPGRITSTGNAGQNQRISGVTTSAPAPLSVTGSSGSYTQYGGSIPGASTVSPTSTYNPQQAGLNTSGGGGAALAATDTYNGAGGVDQYAAAQQAKLADARNAVSNLVGSITGVYDALYGDIGNVAREKTAQLESTYGRQIDNLTGEYNDMFPTIGKGYSARGAYDSSYRQDAEATANRGFQRSLGDVNANKQQDLAKVGQYIAQTQADINAQKGGVTSILDQIGGIEDENTLTNLRNELDTKLRTLQASRAGNQSQAQYLSTLNQTVPGASRAGEIRTNLQNVLTSAVPTALKRSVATQLVNGAGLDPSVAQALMGEINLQLTEEEKQAQAA